MSKAKAKEADKSRTETALGDDGRPQRDLNLSEEDAKAGGPADESVLGEEDPGAGLEFLVKPDRDAKDKKPD